MSEGQKLNSEISITILKDINYAAMRMGVETDALLARSGLEKSIFSDKEGFVSMDKFIKFYHAVLELSNNPHFGLHHGEMFQFTSIGILGLVMINASNGREIYEKFMKFQDILGGDLHFKTEENETRFKIKVELDKGRDPLIDLHCISSILVKNLKGVQLCVTDSLRPLEVKLSFPKPNDVSEYKRVFGIDALFNQSENSITFSRSILDAENPLADSTYANQFEALAESILSKLENQELFATKVSRLILNQIDESELTIESIADKLALSVRNLQRKLSDEGTSFQQLLNEMRKTVAIKYLNDGHMAISEISYVLGFSEPSAFHRSFKRWTGETPQSYRKSFQSV
jgi:AraC-like DNA-binding protein